MPRSTRWSSASWACSRSRNRRSSIGSSLAERDAHAEPRVVRRPHLLDLCAERGAQRPALGACARVWQQADAAAGDGAGVAIDGDRLVRSRQRQPEQGRGEQDHDHGRGPEPGPAVPPASRPRRARRAAGTRTRPTTGGDRRASAYGPPRRASHLRHRPLGRGSEAQWMVGLGAGSSVDGRRRWRAMAAVRSGAEARLGVRFDHAALDVGERREVLAGSQAPGRSIERQADPGQHRADERWHVRPANPAGARVARPACCLMGLGHALSVGRCAAQFRCSAMHSRHDGVHSVADMRRPLGVLVIVVGAALGWSTPARAARAFDGACGGSLRLLVDRSASMAEHDPSGGRADGFAGALQEARPARLGDAALPFAGELGAPIDLAGSGDGWVDMVGRALIGGDHGATGLGAVLTRAAASGAAPIVVLTDAEAELPAPESADASSLLPAGLVVVGSAVPAALGERARRLGVRVAAAESAGDAGRAVRTVCGAPRGRWRVASCWLLGLASARRSSSRGRRSSATMPRRCPRGAERSRPPGGALRFHRRLRGGVARRCSTRRDRSSPTAPRWRAGSSAALIRRRYSSGTAWAG